MQTGVIKYRFYPNDKLSKSPTRFFNV